MKKILAIAILLAVSLVLAYAPTASAEKPNTVIHEQDHNVFFGEHGAVAVDTFVSQTVVNPQTGSGGVLHDTLIRGGKILGEPGTAFSLNTETLVDSRIVQEHSVVRTQL